MLDWTIQVDKVLKKYMILAAPLSLAAGVLFPGFFDRFSPAVPWLFAGMTFCGSLGSRLGQLAEEFRHPKGLLAVLALLHLVMPLAAWGLGNLFFSYNPYFVVGILLEYTIPTAVASLMWIGIYQGSTTLGLAVLMADVLLSPVAIPLTVQALAGSSVQVDAAGMVMDLLLMVTIPALLAMGVNRWTKGRAARDWSPRLSLVSKLCMMLVIAANSTKVAPYFAHLNGTLVGIAAVILALTALGYLLGWLLGWKLGLPFPQDIPFGTLATLIGCAFTWLLRGARVRGLPVLSALSPVVWNTLIIGWEINAFFLPEGPSWMGFLSSALGVGLGELAACCVLGLLLTAFLEKTGLSRLFREL